MRYFLMNKDTRVAVFATGSSDMFRDILVLHEEESTGKMPYGFSNIGEWLEKRKASKHSAHIRRLMKDLGCENDEGFIRLTHAATINDTFWIKAENEDIHWKDVSLYANRFTDAISRLAFEGMGLTDTEFSSTSPELSCEGSFRKCFRKEGEKGQYGSDIFIYKRGGEIGEGLEPYCEMLASEIAGIISPRNSVRYETALLHGKLASKCSLFTDENTGYASFSKVNNRERLLPDVFSFFEKMGFEQDFREMMVIDALCFNQDRHRGNYGFLFDNDTLGITGMAPVFDLNLSMLPYVETLALDNVGDRLFDYGPKLGDDFTRLGQMGLNDAIRGRVKDIADFSFSFRGDDVFTEERVKKLENIVRMQAKAVLSHDVLRTEDVFFSERAAERDKFRKKVEKAQKELKTDGR